MSDLRNKLRQQSQDAQRSWGGSYPLFTAVIAARNLAVGAEIGVAFAGHAEAILSLPCVRRLYGVDPYLHMRGYRDPMNLPQEEFDELYRFVLDRLAPFGDRYRHVRDRSEPATAEVPDPLDFVYIDADHSYEGAGNDLRAWFPKVRPGGIIGGHDYGHPDHPGVQRAVDEFFAPLGWAIRTEGQGVWWVEKQTTPPGFAIPPRLRRPLLQRVRQRLGSLWRGE